MCFLWTNCHHEPPVVRRNNPVRLSSTEAHGLHIMVPSFFERAEPSSSKIMLDNTSLMFLTMLCCNKRGYYDISHRLEFFNLIIIHFRYFDLSRGMPSSVMWRQLAVV
jgi:hypothetical protein